MNFVTQIEVISADKSGLGAEVEGRGGEEERDAFPTW